MENIIEDLKRAVEYTKKRDFKQAEKIYSELNKKYPDTESVLSFTGLFYYNIGKYKKSEKYLDNAYKISQSKQILSYLGLVKFHLTKYFAAIRYLERAVEENKTLEIFRALLISCSKSESWVKAYEYGKEAIELFPFDKTILSEFSFACIFSGHFKETELYTRKLLTQYPKYSNAYYNLGLLQEVLYGNEVKAREYYKKMVSLGDKSSGYFHLAISYLKNAETREKGYYYLKKARKITSDYKGLNFLFAQYHLSKRQFKKGYKYYVTPDIVSQDDLNWYKQFKHPWTGGSFKDDVLLVYGDQGIGDQIQFSRYLPFLQKKFKQLKVVVSESLIDIFKLSFKEYKNIKFYARENKSFPKYDKSVQLANVLYFLNKDFNNIPGTSGYLDFSKEKVKEYQTKFFNNDKQKIGICWEAGATGLKEQIHRTLNIELFEKIIKLKNAQIYSFQVKPSLENYKKYSEIIDLGSTFKDFSDTAAALKNLDILVTVDTSVAHLAGALGVKTYLILPYCSDWRWFDNTETTEWYDSIKIFKQKPYEDWDSVFERIEKNI